MSGKETGYVHSKLVIVRGDQGTGDSTTDFRFSLGQFAQRVTRVSIPHVEFRNNAYNINSSGGGANNTWSISSGLTTYNFSVAAGWYTTSSLMSAVQDAINTTLAGLGDGQSVSLSQDATTYLVSLSYTSGTGPATITIEDRDERSGVWGLLGFVPPSDVGSTALVATYFPSLGGLTEAYLRSTALAPSNMLDTGGNLRNTLLTIPITAEFGKLNVFECKVDSLCEISYMTARNLQEIDIQLTDYYGNVIDLHGANLSITLKIWFNKY
jgi:hypothetical protein